jgi:hypothetical protein
LKTAADLISIIILVSGPWEIHDHVFLSHFLFGSCWPSSYKFDISWLLCTIIAMETCFNKMLHSNGCLCNTFLTSVFWYLGATSQYNTFYGSMKTYYNILKPRMLLISTDAKCVLQERFRGK